MKRRIGFRLKTNNRQRVQPVQTIHGRTDQIQSLAFSPKDTYLAVGCIDGGFDIYDVKNQFKSLGLRSSSKRNFEENSSTPKTHIHFR